MFIYIRSLILIMVVFLTFVDAHAESKRKMRKREHRTSALQQHTAGVGLALSAGTDSGVTALVPWQHNSFFQASLGVSFLKGVLATNADYILEFPSLLENSSIVPYAGGGVTFVMGSHYKSLISEADGTFNLGGRLPLGAYMLLDGLPIQVFGEFVPGLLLMSAINPILSVSLGFRWMF